MTTSSAENRQGLKLSLGTTTALGLTGLFLASSVTFVLHFNLIHAPVQGSELEAYLLAASSQSPDVLLDAGDILPGPTFPRLLLDGVLHFSGGAVQGVRLVGLFLHVFAVALLFLLLRSWLNRRDTITTPLLGSLLLAVSPAAVGVISQAGGWPMLWAADFFLLASVFYLSGTGNSVRHHYGRLALCCWCAALAAAAHPLMAATPLVVVVMEWFRVRETGSRVFSPEWRSPLMVLASGAAVFLVLAVGGTEMTFDFMGLTYPGTIVGALLLCRVVESLPVAFVRRGLAVVMAILIPLGAGISFWLALACVDPAVHLEKRVTDGDGDRIRNRLAMQYYEKALRQDNPEERRIWAGQAADAWKEDASLSVEQALLRARALADAGNAAEAAAAAAFPLNEDPFAKAGVAAARLSASSLAAGRENEAADLFQFASENGEHLSQDEVLRRARVLVNLGDIETAREVLAKMPGLPKESPEGAFQRSITDVSNSARTLQESYRKKISQDPRDLSAYVDHAKGSLLAGNSLRAFYFLEMALRREPANREAWEYLGMVFARESQASAFITRWGAASPERSQAWFSLAGRAAKSGLWDAAFEYARIFAGDGVPSAEEYMAVFAMESKQADVAEQWVTRAIEAHPQSYSPRLLQADIALARNAPDAGLAFLEAARRLQAPEDELRKRMERLPGSPSPAPVPGESFEPVRTYIQ